MRRKPNFWFLLAVTYLSTLIFAGEGMLDRRMTVPVEVTYSLSPTDSQVSAIEEAREIARQDAASRAGTYIEGITELKNDNLTETIREVQTSVVRLTNETTEFAVTPDAPNGKLTLRATAEVDTSTLEDRIKALEDNRELQKRVQALARENTRLKSELRDMANSEVSGMQRLDLERRRLRLESQITENREKLLSAFDGGSLLAFRQKEDVQLSLKNQKLEREVFDPLLEVQVYAEIESASGNDTKTTARINVISEPAPGGVMHRILGWFQSPASLKVTRQRSSDLNDDYKITEYRMKKHMDEMEDFNIHALSQLDYLQGYLLATEIEMGSKRVYVPVLGVAATSFGLPDCRNEVVSRDELFDSNWSDALNPGRRDITRAICAFNSEESQSQTIEVTVSNEEAAEITSIGARRVLIDLKEKRIL